MRSCESGERSRPRRWSGLWLAGLLALLCLPEGSSGAPIPAREAWVFEQLATPSLATAEGEPRNQLAANLANYQDSLSLQGTGLMDLREAEVGLKASARSFLALGDRGRQERAALGSERETVGIELARYFATPDRHFGRLGVELLDFLSGSAKWLRIDLYSGILDTPELPWSLELGASYFVTLSHRMNVLAIRGETARVLTHSAKEVWQLGGALSWIYSMNDTGAPGLYEHMCLSLGPVFQWSGALGVWHLLLAERLWLDTEVSAGKDASGNPITLTGYPSEWSPAPDVSLTWTVPL